tara:strand:+ start:855 stop:1526 length:672 start_codon:yes stop_codon:yes gene_type:complete
MDNEPNFSVYSYHELLDAEKHIDKEFYPQRYDAVIKLLNDRSHNPDGKHEALAEINVDKYSTFWPRFWAATIDGIVFIIILYIECLIFGIEYSAQNNFLQALNGVQFAIYAIFMHGYFGQTLGKMFMGVKVLNHDTETDICIKQALRRESVNLILNIAWVIIILVLATSLTMSDTIPTEVSYAVVAFGLLAMAWGISEFVTMLFNHKRRAIHDYIGKTVVIRI